MKRQLWDRSRKTLYFLDSEGVQPGRYDIFGMKFGTNPEDPGAEGMTDLERKGGGAPGRSPEPVSSTPALFGIRGDKLWQKLE